MAIQESRCSGVGAGEQVQVYGTGCRCVCMQHAPRLSRSQPHVLGLWPMPALGISTICCQGNEMPPCFSALMFLHYHQVGQ